MAILNDMKNKVSRNTKGSGKLAASLTATNVNKSKYMTRYIISPNVPYNMWIEWGSDAPFGIPYSKPPYKKYKGEFKDYSKSQFKGVKYLSGPLTKWRKKTEYGKVFTDVLKKQLAKL
jgi:hypothetical protein